MKIILETAIIAAVLGLLIGVALGFFREKFAIPSDPLVDKIRAILPGANCGACGFAGCDAYAIAVAHRTASPDRCTTGGKKAGDQIAPLLGLTSSAVDQIRVLVCQGSNEKAPLKADYAGIQSCRAAKITAGGTKLCQWSCIGLPHVDTVKCTGCGKCVDACPQNVLIRVSRTKKGAIPLCSNRNPVKSKVIATCKAGCIKCEICVKSCPEGAIHMERGLPVVDEHLCTSCGICVAKCPTKVFKLIEKDIIRS
jgi:electron transport complex protein RnfB